MKFKTNKPIILASGSPRRKELLMMLGVDFDIVTSHADENNAELLTTSFSEYALNNAMIKASAVAKDYRDAVVIGADTIVGLGKRIFPKPKNKEEAKAFLNELSGQTHTVTTAVVIIMNDEKFTFANETKVTFYELTNALIDIYIASGDSLDKAGAYGIQSGGALFVEAIEGDYYSVMGLPIAALFNLLETLGIVSLEGCGNICQ